MVLEEPAPPLPCHEKEGGQGLGALGCFSPWTIREGLGGAWAMLVFHHLTLTRQTCEDCLSKERESLLQVRLVQLPGCDCEAHVSRQRTSETPLPSRLCWLEHQPARTRTQSPDLLAPRSLPFYKLAQSPVTISVPSYFHL